MRDGSETDRLREEKLRVKEGKEKDRRERREDWER